MRGSVVGTLILKDWRLNSPLIILSIVARRDCAGDPAIGRRDAIRRGRRVVLHLADLVRQLWCQWSKSSMKERSRTWRS